MRLLDRGCPMALSARPLLQLLQTGGVQGGRSASGSAQSAGRRRGRWAVGGMLIPIPGSLATSTPLAYSFPR